MKKNKEDRIWTLLAQKLNGEADFRALRELDKLLEREPAMKEQCSIIETLFLITVAKISMPEQAYKKLLRKIYRLTPFY